MIKNLKQAINFLFATEVNFNFGRKNLKIRNDIHQKLKEEAAREQINMGDYADLLLTIGMSKFENYEEARAKMIEKMREKT